MEPGTTEYEPPRGPIEIALAEIWRSSLHIDKVGCHDNFFELGGQSVVAMEVLARIAERLGVEPPLVTLFQYPTIRELADSVASLLSKRNAGTRVQFEEGLL